MKNEDVDDEIKQMTARTGSLPIATVNKDLRLGRAFESYRNSLKG